MAAPKPIRLKAYAKINLSLRITGRAENGFHMLDMLMASVDIYDIVSLTIRDDKAVNIRMADASGAPFDIALETNTAYKAAKALISEFNLPGCDVSIIKNIPLAAGLGGSSADAAGVIYGLCKLHDIDVKGGKIMNIALGAGSDVPYMLTGGFARVTGLGEIVDSGQWAVDGGQIKPGDKNCKLLHMIIAKGTGGCSTAEAYAAFDQMTNYKRKMRKKNNFSLLTSHFANDLQAASISLCPEIAGTLKLLQSTNPLCAQMTGSGSACFALYESETAARAAHDKIAEKIEYCRVCETVEKGIEETNLQLILIPFQKQTSCGDFLI